MKFESLVESFEVSTAIHFLIHLYVLSFESLVESFEVSTRGM